MTNYKEYLLLCLLCLVVGYMTAIVFNHDKIIERDGIVSNLKPGYFINSPAGKQSYYITRLVSENESMGKSEGACIIQNQFPSGKFENCIYNGALENWMEVTNCTITRYRKYGD